MENQAQEQAVTEFETVEGIDAATIKLKREYEAQVEHKVMNESTHIIWAYGLLWVIFAAYAIYLTRKSSSLQADLQALQGELNQQKGV